MNGLSAPLPFHHRTGYGGFGVAAIKKALK
jgi:hypothetical protein